MHSEMVTVVKLINISISSHSYFFFFFLRLGIGFIYSKLACFFTRLWTLKGRDCFVSVLIGLV